jgi:hypothetical protein
VSRARCPAGAGSVPAPALRAHAAPSGSTARNPFNGATLSTIHFSSGNHRKSGALYRVRYYTTAFG